MPSQVGPYRVVALIGEGGMGQVYRARDERLGRDVALKVLHATSAADATRQRRFLQEARAAGSLTHPNIVAVYDVGVDAGVSYIVTELVDGSTLRDELGRGRVPLARALHLATQIADGLTAAHRAGFVHRDLKPDNVMVTPAGGAKIVDFGLAMRAERDAQTGSTDATLTAPHVVLGTASYMSPEQARGATLDFRSDLFAFGAVLYEMLTSRRAFERPSVIETLSAVLSETPTPVRELNPGCPEELARLVDRCLAKAPDDRYAATADLHHDLMVVRDGLRQPARPAPHRRLGRVVRVSVGLAGIAVVGAAIWLLRPPAGGVDLSTYQILPLATEAGYEGQAAWSRDGRLVAYVAEVDGVLQVMRRTVGPMGQSIDSEPAVRLTDSPVDCRFPFWSADGSRVFFISQARHGEALWSVSAAVGGRREVVLENVNHAVLAHDGSLVFLREQEDSQASQGLRYSLWIKPPGPDAARRFAPDWIGEGTLGEGYLSISPDGSRIALSGSPARRTHPDAGFDDVEVWVFPYPSGTPSRVLQDLTLPRAYPVSWMPDNRHILFGADFVGSASGTRLWRADIETGHLEPLTATTAREHDPAVSPDGARIAFTSDTSTFDLIEIPTDGSAPFEPRGSRDESEPVWLPNGRQYAYVSNRNGHPEVWRADQADPLSHRVVVRSSQFTDGPTFLFTRLAFAPGGDRLVYQRRNRDGYYLWISMLAGGPAERLVTHLDFDYQDAPTWSPDGQWIAFTFAKHRTWGLARVKPGEPDVHVILDRLAEPCDPHWAPEADQITCQQAQGLFSVTTDGQRRQLTNEVWLAHDWSDHRTLFGIRETDDLRLQLVRLDVPTRILTVVNADLGPSPPARTPLSGFSVSPDGTRILTSLVRLRGDVHLLTGFDRAEWPGFGKSP